MVNKIKAVEFGVRSNAASCKEISKMELQELINTAYNLNMINELVFENLDLNELRIAVINKVCTDRRDKFEDIFDNEKYYSIETDEEGRSCRVYKKCAKCGFIPNNARIESSINEKRVLQQFHDCGNYAAEYWIPQELVESHIEDFEKSDEIKRRILSAVSKKEIILMANQRIMNNI